MKRDGRSLAHNTLEEMLILAVQRAYKPTTKIRPKRYHKPSGYKEINNHYLRI